MKIFCSFVKVKFRENSIQKNIPFKDSPKNKILYPIQSKSEHKFKLQIYDY